MTNLKIVKLEKTCTSYPVQFEGVLEDGRMLYSRYRHGWLSIRISKKPTKYIFDAIDSSSTELFSEKIGDDYDGYMEDPIFLKHLRASGLIIDRRLEILTVE